MQWAINQRWSIYRTRPASSHRGEAVQRSRFLRKRSYYDNLRRLRDDEGRARTSFRESLALIRKGRREACAEKLSTDESTVRTPRVITGLAPKNDWKSTNNNNILLHSLHRIHRIASRKHAIMPYCRDRVKHPLDITRLTVPSTPQSMTAGTLQDDG